MEWIQLKVLVDDETVKDAVSTRLFDLGAEAVSETIEKGISQGVLAFFEASREADLKPLIEQFFKELPDYFPGTPVPQWTLTPAPQENWVEKYKEFYKAQKLSNRFFLRPKWDKVTPIPGGMIPIFMDPGQAFGTGLHPSTRLSIRLIEDITAFYPSVSNIRVMDVGTGTGILAMVATHLGYGEVVAIDNDAPSVEVARENLAENHCESVQVSGQDFATFTKPFDVIVSNILLETHLLLAQHYRRLLVPGGQLILSGLLGSQKRDLEEILKPLGFTPLVSYYLQEWAAFSYTWREKV